ncbi:NHL repeat-containing protein 2 [Dorcoceras hygrometricum]|uniref:NHL repeat-containing protein 2 n=1 Tax=Dorcoceras hygrometricum TaxID=472368 RepID=A0A2Z7BIA8_9LAMI|nr:NHL repeat-containing protein 2 [Dorcoceras hygrometricum]
MTKCKHNITKTKGYYGLTKSNIFTCLSPPLVRNRNSTHHRETIHLLPPQSRAKMALRPLQSTFSPCYSKTHYSNSFILSSRSSFFSNQSPWKANALRCSGRRRIEKMVKSCLTLEDKNVPVTGSEWGKVSAVLFDMDGVLCNSEELSRLAAVDVFAEMGVQVTVQDFVPFMGTGEANFLGGVAAVKSVKGFNPELAKKRFFEIYLDKYAKPNSGIGFPGAYELVIQCKDRGLKVAVASSADRIKVDANLAAAGLQLSLFDAIVSADAFENLKPAPDIFLAASKILDVTPSECIVIEDALAGVQAAKSAGMRCIAVTTTLAEDTLKTEYPSLIRKDIGDISLDDILNGGSDCHNPKKQPSQSNSVPQSLNNIDGSEIKSFQENDSVEDAVLSVGGLQGSRRNILRYGSLGIAVSCFYFSVVNWRAMQYVSPKAIWNSVFGAINPSFGQKGEAGGKRIQQFIHYISDLDKRGTATTVPEFPSKLDWLNASPLQFRRDLKGKVVLLDFWTYCCINCMHVLPDLEFLEKKYKDMPFVVVGVHSAKFDNEKDLEAIRNAVLRYGVTHPVVNDGDMYLWRELGVNSWPTFALVDPKGKLIAQIAGEGHREDLDDLVDAALTYYGTKNILDNTPISLSLEKNNDPRLFSSPLKFPGKLEVDILNNRLFISDSNHNRIVVTDLDGNFKMQIGFSGEEGLRDGTFDDAMFNRPQGLAYDAKRNLLYVADTENHALRVVDFVNENVQTLAGNGTKGSDYKGGGSGITQLLNSPWDVCFDPVSDIVYIAMAGQHQIWKHNTLERTTTVFSGDGYERNLNGSSSGSTSFAQPSGISLSTGMLNYLVHVIILNLCVFILMFSFIDFKEAYIADSESSSIRALDLRTGGSRLLAGGDPMFSDNLFKFGDHDGVGSEVLLQHPLGVFCGYGQIYIADSYNHKIKILDLASRRVSTLAGTGKAGFKDGSASVAQLSEPSGLAEAGNGRLFIADTNNSVIRYIDLNEKEPVLLTLELKGVPPPAPKSKSLRRLRRRSEGNAVTVPIDGSSATEGKLCLKIMVPEDYHLSKEAQSKFTVESEPENAISINPLDGNINREGFAIVRFKRSSPSPAKSKIYCKIYYCKEDEVCLYQPLMFDVSFQEALQDATPSEITLPYIVKPKSSTFDLPSPVPQ